MAAPSSVDRDGEKPSGSGNIRPSGIPLMPWEPENTCQSLAALYLLVESRVVDAIDWYLDEKRSKSKWSRGLRVLAIILGAIGALIPLINLASQEAIAVQWGYVALALATAAVALDRFFGFSSAWMRYLTTSFRLQRLLADFQLEWAIRSAQLEGSIPPPREAKELLMLLKQVLCSTIAEVEKETLSWVSEFQSNVTGIDRNLQGISAASDPRGHQNASTGSGSQ